MKINKKAIALMALVVSVVLVSGCSQSPAKNATTSESTTPAATQIKSQQEASKTVVDTSKDVKKISDTLSDIDNTLAVK